MHDRAVHPLRYLLAGMLAYLARRSPIPAAGPPGSPDWIDPAPVEVTQDEIAAMFGVARQTINRTMAEFLRKKIVVREGADSVRVIDFRKLVEVLEAEDPVPPEWRSELLSWDDRLRAEEARGE
jgi:hypothetical protein